MQGIWVVTANASQAVVYQAEKRKGPLVEYKRFSHPEARMHEYELTTDLPGRAFDSAGYGRHAMEQPVDVKKHEAEKFAKEIADYLHHACGNGECKKLYIAASPVFLGMLRKHYTKPISEVLVQELDLDLTTQDAEAVRSHLPEYL